jgi:anaerobic selenocysteine-containing dehydrogenase
MQLVVDRFNDALATDGPDGVGIYNSGQLLLEEYYTLGKIARAGLGIATIDANTRLCTATTASSLMESFGADGPPGAFEDFERTECIVLIGHNAAEQSTVLWMRIPGGEGWTAASEDHRGRSAANPDGHIGRDLHLQLKPGTNVALLNGLCHLLIENGTIDRDFIAKHTVRFDRFAPSSAGTRRNESRRSAACPLHSCGQPPNGSAARPRR